MSTADLKARVQAGELLTGTFLNLGSPLAAEACAIAGFDWLLVDLEHGGGTERQLIEQLLAGDAHGVPSIVRVESLEPIRAGRALDMGAAGVMFPRLRTAEDAQRAVSSMRYPPLGSRGIASYNRAGAFGLNASGLETRALRCVGVLQVETTELVEHLDAVADLDGVDVLFVGPRDLRASIAAAGRSPGAFDEALERVLQLAGAGKIAAGIMASTEAELAGYVSRGFTFNAFASDSAMLASASRDVLHHLTALQRNGRFAERGGTLT